ncbi:MAG: oligosaccharide biosynthesis protein Alg14 [Paludibacteraceae bacterium]|nr:oligosaccharide biosynthesis protein Alg14 [Paludibacteraceae bacterium]
MGKKKIIAVASIGGHWIQLLRIARPLEERYEVVYVSTHPKCATMVEGHKFFQTGDFSRSNAWKLIPSLFKAVKTIWDEKPDAIITTGAAPGLVYLFVGKLMARKTIWIDSIANAERLSASGRVALRFASRIYTQWKDLAVGKIQYVGNVFGN